MPLSCHHWQQLLYPNLSKLEFEIVIECIITYFYSCIGPTLITQSMSLMRWLRQKRVTLQIYRILLMYVIYLCCWWHNMCMPDVSPGISGSIWEKGSFITIRTAGHWWPLWEYFGDQRLSQVNSNHCCYGNCSRPIGGDGDACALDRNNW